MNGENVPYQTAHIQLNNSKMKVSNHSIQKFVIKNNPTCYSMYSLLCIMQKDIILIYLHI
jgi:hypothetical protein